MPQSYPFEPPRSARRAAIFRQADEARRIAAELRHECARIRALVEHDRPYREAGGRRSDLDGGRGARSED